MNERIRKLAEQAGLEFDDDEALEFGKQIYYVTKEDMEKFAELIMKETLNVLCDKMDELDINLSNLPAWYKALERTENHFGVKDE